MIALAVFIVINGGSLRCAAASAQFLASLMGWSLQTERPLFTALYPRQLGTSCGHILESAA
jgi:hypothetical protein